MSFNLSSKIYSIPLVVVAVLSGIWLGFSTQDKGTSSSSATPKIQGAILPVARALTNIQLYTKNDQAFTLGDIKGHWNLVFVGYTNCPDVCPNTLSVINQVDILMKEQELSPPRVIFISIDPDRDKPELIDQYVKYFNKDFIGVTGEEDNLKSIARQLSVVFSKAPGVDGTIGNDNYLMDHSSSLILLNPKAEVQSILTAPHTPMQMIDSIIRSQVYYKQHES